MENMNQLKVYKPNTGFCIGYEVTDTTDPDFPEKHMAVSFRSVSYTHLTLPTIA